MVPFNCFLLFLIKWKLDFLLVEVMQFQLSYFKS